MRRFMAFHETEPGFDSPEAVLDWIAAQENPADYRVVEFTVDPVTERLGQGDIAKARKEGYVAGIEQAKKLLRFQLGLAVPQDLS